MATELVVTPPSGQIQVISTVEARSQCRIETGDDDDLLASYIAAATARAEDVTGRQLLTATRELRLPGPPGCGYIELPRPPLRSVTWIKYLDTAGVTQTWAASNYVVSAPNSAAAKPGRVSLASGGAWPTVLAQDDALQVRFECGYGAPAQVPAMIRQAIRLLVATWYEHREDQVVGQAVSRAELAFRQALLPFKVRPTQRWA